MSKYVAIECKTIGFDRYHIYVIGDVVHGELPSTCVSGSGCYTCVHRRGTFRLYLRYFEVIHMGNEQFFKFYIDAQRSISELPPGLN